MITVLNVKIPIKKNKFVSFINRLKRDKAEVKIKRAHGVCVRDITYYSYSGKIYIETIEKLTDFEGAEILCPENILFPDNCKFKRFESDLFKISLCQNMALKIISSLKKEFKICVYSKSTIDEAFIIHTLKLTSNITILTDNPSIFEPLEQKAMSELGASLRVTSNYAELSDSMLVVAFDECGIQKFINPKSIVLTVKKPDFDAENLYYQYEFSFPSEFSVLKPEWMNEEYFCSALYLQQNQLGNIEPISCSNSFLSQTADSISVYLDSFS